MNLPRRALPHHRSVVRLGALGLLTILLGGCAVHGDVDICPDVRNDESNLLRRQHPPGS